MGHDAPTMSQPWHVLWLWVRLSKEMLLVFVLVEVAAELPDAGFGSCCGLNLPVVWGSETGRVRKEAERWKRRDKVEYSASFYLQKSLCVCAV